MVDNSKLLNSYTITPLPDIFPYGEGRIDKGNFDVLEWTFATPAGNQDATINFIKRGCLIRRTIDNKLYKILSTDTFANFKVGGVILGVVHDIYDLDGNNYAGGGVQFVNDSNNEKHYTKFHIRIFRGKDIPIVAKYLTYHVVNAGTDADSEIPVTDGIITGDLIYQTNVNSDSSLRHYAIR